MSGEKEERAEELPFKVFRKAARLGLRAAREATEATVKIAKTVPKAIPKPPAKAMPSSGEHEGLGGGVAVPFRRRESTRAKLHRSPLESRPAGVMEYHRLPTVRLSTIIGARDAISRLRDALAKGATRVLIVGPPGVGKSVLALAYAAELGKPIIDVNSGDEGLHREGPQLLRDVFEVALREDYTVIIYNIEGLARREYAGRVIIYDPYTPATATPELISVVEEAADRGARIIATATSPSLIAKSLRDKFQAIIPVALPTYEDRREILEAILENVKLSGPSIDDIAAYTAGASVADLVRLSRSLAEAEQPVDHATLSQALRELRLAGEEIVEALYRPS